VAAETGLALEVISATEEASLAFRGTTPLLRANFPYALVFDIGGGSTELGWLRLDRHGRAHILASHSMPLGVVTLTERFGVEPPPGTDPARFYAAMVDAVRSAMWPFAQAIGAGGPISAGQVQMIGTSGTVTTIMGVFLDLPRYDRARVDGGFLQIADFERIAAHLSRQSCGERAAHPCIGRERADLVVAGCAILSAICRQWPVDELRVADRGVREGILMGL
jgi:exopolyphosphatase/guanosine-5'-triphosphate,3'-diphosphate pyrophosphatase